MCGRPVLGTLALSVLAPALVQGVSELGGDLDGVARYALERLGDDLLVLPGAIDVSGVEERDAEVERAAQKVHAFAARDLSPPRRAQRPSAEPDLGAAQVRGPECPSLHGKS